MNARAIAPLVVAGLLASFGHGCASTLGEGELGTPRVAGFVRGAPPDVQVLAPVGDRSGNVYILTGRRDVPDVNVFVGRTGGGFSSGCRLTKGDTYGPHGWVGSSVATSGVSFTGRDFSRADRHWYWSGAALVTVSAFGDCRRVLDRDPATGTDLVFDAVIPWVNDTPSKTTLVALVRAPGEVLPFTVVVDLNASPPVYTVPRAFEPPGATDLVVHGVGGSLKAREGWVLVSFKEGEQTRTEARFYDALGALTSRARIANAGEIGPYGIRGYLESSDEGLVAGVTADKRLVVFDHESGKVVPIAGMDPTGVHRWAGSLYVVGTEGDRPVVAAVDDGGRLAPAETWTASREVAAKLGAGLAVTDDRSPPRRTTRFAPARSTGAFPLVTEHSSFAYADGTTLITVAGPSVGEGDNAFTLVAVAPVGVSYP